MIHQHYIDANRKLKGKSLIAFEKHKFEVAKLHSQMEQEMTHLNQEKRELEFSIA